MLTRQFWISCCVAVIWAMPASASEPLDVSLLNLLATPERYDGRHVRVIGFLKLEFEGNALYLHREDYEQAIFRNAVWVNIYARSGNKIEIVPAFSGKNLSDAYALLEGDFNAGDSGHMGMFGGAITNIRRADKWISRSELEKNIEPDRPK